MTAAQEGRPGAEALEALRELTKEAAALRSHVEALRSHVRARLRVMLGLVVVMVLLLGGLAYLGVQNRAINEQNAQIGQQNAEISRQIADCTTVGGTCYEQSRVRSGDVIKQLVRSNLNIVQCAKSTTTEAALQACVAKKLPE